MLVAPLLEKAKRSKLLIFNEYREFLFLSAMQKTANFNLLRWSKRWSKSGDISSPPFVFVWLCLSACYIAKVSPLFHNFVSLKTSRKMMERNSFSVLFFLKKTKLLKNGEASVCMRICLVFRSVEQPKITRNIQA